MHVGHDGRRLLVACQNHLHLVLFVEEAVIDSAGCAARNAEHVVNPGVYQGLRYLLRSSGHVTFLDYLMGLTNFMM